MAEPTTQDWTSALRQSNAVGWLAFGVLIVGILVGALIFGQGPEKDSKEAAQVPATTTQSALAIGTGVFHVKHRPF